MKREKERNTCEPQNRRGWSDTGSEIRHSSPLHLPMHAPVCVCARARTHTHTHTQHAERERARETDRERERQIESERV